MKSRRRFLQAVGLSTPLLAGCSWIRSGEQTETDRPPGTPTRQDTRTDEQPTGTAATERQTETTETTEATEPRLSSELRSRFDTVIDVTEEGIDPSGDVRVDDTIEELTAHDTLLYFPEGRYPIGHVVLRNVSNFGLYGDGATFDIDERGQNIYLAIRDVDDLLVDGFTVDNTGRAEAAAVDLKCTGGTNRIQNYAVDGFVDIPERTFAFTLMVQGAETELTLENVDLSQGGRNAGAAFVFPERDYYDPSRAAGSLTFRDCVMRGWGKEGLYASAHSGPLRVIGGEYANNAIVQIRIGGGNAPTEAIVRDATVRVTEIPDYVPAGNRLLRGIWLKEGDGALIENCDVEVHNLGRTQTQGGIIVNEQFGRATIRDCQITSSVPRPGIVAENPASEYDSAWMPSLDALPPEWGVTVENSTVDGSISDIEAVHVIGRDGCSFRNFTVERPGRATDGIRLDRIGSCTIADSTIQSTRYPVVVALPESSDDCVVSLEGTTLRGGDVASSDGRVATASDNQFCISADSTVATDTAPQELLGLTRTATDDSATETTASRTSTEQTATGNDTEGTHVLFGQLFDR